MNNIDDWETKKNFWWRHRFQFSHAQMKIINFFRATLRKGISLDMLKKNFFGIFCSWSIMKANVVCLSAFVWMACACGVRKCQKERVRERSKVTERINDTCWCIESRGEKILPWVAQLSRDPMHFSASSWWRHGYILKECRWSLEDQV